MDFKAYRKKEIPMLILGDILLLIYILGIFNFSSFTDENIKWFDLIVTVLNSTILSSVLYLFTIVFDGIFNEKIKYKLVYLFFGKIPGETIFTKIKTKNNDIRFTFEELNQKHSEIYDSMPCKTKEKYIYENKEWYKLLSKNKENDMVKKSHIESLMYRDLYSCNILVTIIYLLLSVVIKIVTFNVRYILCLLFISILLNIAARNKIKRFVYNVIASEMQSMEDN